MARKQTASDRKALIRLASSMSVGSEERRAILAGLSKQAAYNGPVVVYFDHPSSRASSKTYPSPESAVKQVSALYPGRSVGGWSSDGPAPYALVDHGSLTYSNRVILVGCDSEDACGSLFHSLEI